MTKIELKHIHHFGIVTAGCEPMSGSPGRSGPAPGAPRHLEYMAVYQDAIAAAAPRLIGANRTVPGTLDAAIVAYYQDNSFLALGDSTRHTRKVILEHLRRDHGSKRLRTLQRAHVAAIVGAKPPFAARNWLKVMRGLMAFAVNSGLQPTIPRKA